MAEDWKWKTGTTLATERGTWIVRRRAPSFLFPYDRYPRGHHKARNQRRTITAWNSLETRSPPTTNILASTSPRSAAAGFIEYHRADVSLFPSASQEPQYVFRLLRKPPDILTLSFLLCPPLCLRFTRVANAMLFLPLEIGEFHWFKWIDLTLASYRFSNSTFSWIFVPF